MIEDAPPPPRDHVRRAVRPLEYVRPGTPPLGQKPFPAVAGFFIGIAIFVSTTVVWFVLVRSPMGLLYVPLIALVAAIVAENTFEWRGVLLGVLTALGLTVLIPGLALLVICGGAAMTR